MLQDTYKSKRLGKYMDKYTHLIHVSQLKPTNQATNPNQPTNQPTNHHWFVYGLPWCSE